MAMVAPPAPAEGSPTAFTYSSEPQAVPSKRSVRSKYREDATAVITPDAAGWLDENEASKNITTSMKGVFHMAASTIVIARCSSACWPVDTV